MECKEKDNRRRCTCTYTRCDKTGVCCDCIQYHLARRELPGCCFPPDAERTYDRTFKAFARAWNL